MGKGESVNSYNVNSESDMPDLNKFAVSYARANNLLSEMNKTDLAQCLFLLAMNIAHYRSMYGVISTGSTLSEVCSGIPNLAKLEIMTEGLEFLYEVLESNDSSSHGMEEL